MVNGNIFFYKNVVSFFLESTLSRFKTRFRPITLFRSMTKHRVYVNYADTAFNRPIDIA